MAIDANLGSLNVKITLDTSSLKKGQDEVSRSLDKTSKNVDSSKDSWDKLKPKIDNAAKASTNLAVSQKNVKTQIDKTKTAANSSSKAIKGLGVNLDKAKGSSTRFKKEHTKTNSGLRNNSPVLKDNTSLWDNWGRSIRNAAGAFTAAAISQKLIQYSDAATSINNKLKLATKSTKELEKVTNDLFRSANQTRSSIEGTVDLYTKMERATRSLNINQDRLLKITGSVNKAFSISGATTAEASGSIRQLGQALASGALRGDEFNSIAEQAPIIMEAVSAATGKTAGELRKYAEQGLITSEILIKSLEEYSDTIDREFATATATFSQSLEVAGNKAIEFVAQNEAIKSASKAAGDAVIFVSDNLDSFGKILIGVGAIITGRVLGPAIATNAVFIAMRAAAFVAAGGLGVLASAATAARGALAFLGGPVGVIVAASVALATFIDWESKAEKQTRETTKALDDQSESFKGLTKSQNENKISELLREQKTAESQIDVLNGKLKEVQETLKRTSGIMNPYGGMSNSFETAKNKAEELNKQIAKLKDSAQLAKKGISELETINFAADDTNSKNTGVDLDAASRKKAEQRLKKIAEQEARKREIIKSASEKTFNDLRDSFASELELENSFHAESLQKLNNAVAQKISLGQDAIAVAVEAQEIELGLISEHELAKQEIISQATSGALTALTDSYATELELNQAFHDEQIAKLREAIEIKRLLGADELALAIEEQAIELGLIKSHEEKKTAILEDETAKRIRETKKERMSNIQNATLGANALLAIAGAFGSKSEKQQKRLRRAQVVIDTAAGVMSAFATAGNIYSALALSAVVVATGKKQLDAINSGSPSSGGTVGGSGGGASLSARPPEPPQQSQGQGQRTVQINLTGGAAQLFSVDQVRGLIEQINEQISDGVELSGLGA